VNLAITVLVKAAVPPYEQIRSQIADHILSGHLTDNDRLPTVRALAADLGVAANTVSRAYSELEADGLVASRRRTGTVVTRRPDRPDDESVRQAAARLAEEAHRAGLGDDTVLAIVRNALLTDTPARTAT
jgi:GntR family transcriptional regulator